MEFESHKRRLEQAAQGYGNLGSDEKGFQRLANKKALEELARSGPLAQPEEKKPKGDK